MIDIDALEALAKAATPGPWEGSAYGGVHPTGRGGSIVTALTKSGMYDGWAGNAPYIAAANPTAILALVAEVRALRAGEPNMRHPKIQALLSAQARYRYELAIIDDLISDPEHEYTGTDYDYQTNLTDKVEAFVKAARADKARLDSGCIMTNERDEFGDEYKCERRGNDLRKMIDEAITARAKEKT
jgi:hypothetical protein